MKFSAIDIHQKEFTHAMRGYREEEVDDFLDLIANEVDRLNKENEELIGRIRFTESKLEGLDAERSAITETLINAQRSADELLKSAGEKAEAKKLSAEAEAAEMLAAAESSKREILNSAENTKREILNSLKRLKADEERFRSSYTRLLEESLASVREIRLPEAVAAEFEPKADSFAAAVARAEASEAPLEPEVVENLVIEETEVVEFAFAAPAEEFAAVEPAPELVVEAVDEPAVEEVFEPVAEPVLEPVVETPEVAPEPDVSPSSFFADEEVEEVVEEPAQVSGLIIGERESEAPLDLTMKEPRDFEIPGGYRWGEREDDLIIEEID